MTQGHREPVSSLHWRRGPGYGLASAARDGKLLLWKYSEAKQQLQLVKKWVKAPRECSVRGFVLLMLCWVYPVAPVSAAARGYLQSRRNSPDVRSPY